MRILVTGGCGYIGSHSIVELTGEGFEVVIIDNLSNKLKDININDENINISKDIIDGINEDYRSFITNKETLHTILRDFNKKMNTQIDDLSMPNLDRYLEPKYAYVKDRVFKCELCNDFVGKNKQALSSHKRGCKKKHDINVDTTILRVEPNNNYSDE